jgi:hypothetical protein
MSRIASNATAFSSPTFSMKLSLKRNCTCYTADAVLAGIEFYQWSCSALEADENRYSLPHFIERGDDPIEYIMSNQADFLVSEANVLYVYSIPPSLNCNGTVSEVGYCYFIDSDALAEQENFTLLILKQDGPVFNISSRIRLSFPSIIENCTIVPSGGHYCCESSALAIRDRFQLPAPNFAFGVLSPSPARLLQFDPSIYPQYLVQHYRGRLSSMGVRQVTGFLREGGLPLLQFFIGAV